LKFSWVPIDVEYSFLKLIFELVYKQFKWQIRFMENNDKKEKTLDYILLSLFQDLLLKEIEKSKIPLFKSNIDKITLRVYCVTIMAS